MTHKNDIMRTTPCGFSTRCVSGFVVLLGAILLASPAASAADANGTWFENPPLRYDGPDPTSHYFLPPRVAQVQQESVGAGWSSVPATGLPAMVPFHESELVPEYCDEPFLEDGFVGGGVTEFKNGFFQKLGVTETWIDRDGRDDFGIHEVDTFVTVAVPAPTREWPLLISPTFNARFLDGPFAPDLPPRVYETYVDFLWVPRLSPRWLAILGVAPSYYGDFKVDNSEAFRITGKALARYDWSPTVQLLFGVLYLNRNDIRLLPAGGIIWMPNDAKRYELVFPKPKLAHRITLGDNFEDWLYLGGEFGGNTYAIERDAGFDDFVTFRDIRTYVGLERKLNGGAGYRLEIGYVFARRVEYDSATPDIEAEDAILLRGGFTF